jgi:predicted RNA binding protein YcfA (HicA-like mRNA interferase family)
MASGRLAVAKRTITQRLRDEGFELARQTGSHQQWKHYHLRRTVTVPDRPELKGNLVKNIYTQAGWAWTEKKEECPAPVIPLTPPAPAPVTPSATLPALPPEPEQSQAAPEKEEKPMAPRRHWRDREEIEIMALDALDHPYTSMLSLATKWKISSSSFARIKSGEHQKVSHRTRLMLRLAFGKLNIVGAPEILKEYETKPESLPDIVRRRIKTQLGEEEAKQIVLPSVMPKKEEPKPEPKAEEVVAAMDGVIHAAQEVAHAVEAPRNIAKPSTEKRSLRDTLESVREMMRAQGIVKLVLPIRGDIVIQRKEILV